MESEISDTPSRALTATCHCGAVTVEVAATPAFINECNCGWCGKLGAWWGYYAPAEVEVRGATQSYARADRHSISSESGDRFRDSEMRPQTTRDPVVKLHFCGTCGCTTHFRTMDGFAERTGVADVMGVNMRLFAREDLRGVELRYPDGKGWDGIGQWGFVREAETL